MLEVVQNQELIDSVSRYRSVETPFMLTSLDVITQNCRSFKQAMPTIQLFYAVKALYSEQIITAMIDYVDGFDVASTKEITDLLSYGIKPETLNFSNPVKSPQSIQDAYRYGVKDFTFQSRSEIDKIQRYAPGATVYARVKMNDTRSTVPLSDKFGCLQSEVISLLRHAGEVGLHVGGLTFHVGSQLLDSTIWKESIRAANALVKEANENGIEIDRINVGGGFPARYFTDDSDLVVTARDINASLDPSIKYLAEPGRYIVADASVIVSKVIGIESRDHSNWAFLDTGLFQSFLGAERYDVFPYRPTALAGDDEHVLSSDALLFTLTGPSCDSHDVIAHDIQLPSNIKEGDLLIFPNTGAYTIVYGSTFNGFPIPKQYYLKAGSMV